MFKFNPLPNPVMVLRRVLDRAGRRLRQARPGSVLILVIALLVLMALIGTAFISTAHTDRYAATHNTYSTQVELLMDGATRMAEAPLLTKLQGFGSFRQASTVIPPTANIQQYLPYDSPITDSSLADRTPRLLDPTKALGPTNPPVWGYISAPLGGLSFDVPYGLDASGNRLQVPLHYTLTSAQADALRSNLVPSSLTITMPDGTIKTYPSFTLNLQNQTMQAVNSSGTVVPAAQPIRVIAADADGDGIADSLFVRLPIGQVEGATYYGAVRVIDNNSAINASVAIGPFSRDDSSTGVAGDFFPTNIDLLHLLVTFNTATPSSTAEMTQLNNWRFQNNGVWAPTPVDDNMLAHRDYVFSSAAEAAWFQLGSRLDWPGPNGPSDRFRSLPLGDAGILPYHGGMVNQNASPNSILEANLQQSMGINGVASAGVNRPPYLASDVTTWYNSIYNYALNGLNNVQGQAMPLRPILVARNPVSSFVPSYFPDRGSFSDPTLPLPACTFGDRIQYFDPIAQRLRGFVCVRPNPGDKPVANGVYNTAEWAAMPWTSHPTRINVNTGTFGQLWSAFWSVMQDTPDVNNAYPQTPGTGITPTDVSVHQFRSPLRYRNNPQSPPPSLSRSQVIQLRSALAAVAAIDMRDGDEDLTSRTITLTSPAGGLLFANVFGAEKQPFITEMLIEYNPSGDQPQVPYVVFELYNPHPTPISLKNWKLAKLTRGPQSIGLTEVGDLTKTLTTASATSGTVHPGGPIINPGERIVIESETDMEPATLRTQWSLSKYPVYTCQGTTGAGNLATVAGNELVLLRPRNANGFPIQNNTAPDNFFDEGIPAPPNSNGPAQMNVTEMAPVDQVDLVGLTPPDPNGGGGPGGNPPPQRYRYARANQPTRGTDSAAWHCVYPGPYNVNAPVDLPNGGKWPYHLAGLIRVGSGAQGDTLPPNDGSLGQPKTPLLVPNDPAAGGSANTTSTYETRPLQINNRDFAGPNRPYTDAPGGLVAQASPQNWPFRYPLGGFARNGDILNVPFIGAYQIFTVVNNQKVLLEENSVGMDAVMAQFKDPASFDANFLPTKPKIAQFYSDRYDMDYTTIPGAWFHQEQIGHFCPMSVQQPLPADPPTRPTPPPPLGTAPSPTMDDLDDPSDPGFVGNQTQWTYHFAKRLFDYLAVYTPQDDYVPNIDPGYYIDPANGPMSGDPSVPGSNPKDPGIFTVNNRTVNPPPSPAPVPNGPTARTTTTANLGREDTASIEGLINLNTANWRVLAAIPFYSPNLDAPANSAQYVKDNAIIAQQIWTWRESLNANGTKNGPFRSAFDLMKWSGYNQLNAGYLGFNPGEASNANGDYSPYARPQSTVLENDITDHVFGDVKTRFLLLQRISNLVTVRSDSFTVYTQVQGWQNVGSPYPDLVAQRRSAALVDRSTVKPTHGTTGNVGLTPANVTTVPNN